MDENPEQSPNSDHYTYPLTGTPVGANLSPGRDQFSFQDPTSSGHSSSRTEHLAPGSKFTSNLTEFSSNLDTSFSATDRTRLGNFTSSTGPSRDGRVGQPGTALKDDIDKRFVETQQKARTQITIESSKEFRMGSTEVEKPGSEFYDREFQAMDFHEQEFRAGRTGSFETGEFSDRITFESSYSNPGSEKGDGSMGDRGGQIVSGSPELGTRTSTGNGDFGEIPSGGNSDGNIGSNSSAESNVSVGSAGNFNRGNTAGFPNAEDAELNLRAGMFSDAGMKLSHPLLRTGAKMGRFSGSAPSQMGLAGFEGPQGQIRGRGGVETDDQRDIEGEIEEDEEGERAEYLEKEENESLHNRSVLDLHQNLEDRTREELIRTAAQLQSNIPHRIHRGRGASPGSEFSDRRRASSALGDPELSNPSSPPSADSGGLGGHLGPGDLDSGIGGNLSSNGRQAMNRVLGNMGVSSAGLGEIMNRLGVATSRGMLDDTLLDAGMRSSGRLTGDVGGLAGDMSMASSLMGRGLRGPSHTITHGRHPGDLVGLASNLQQQREAMLQATSAFGGGPKLGGFNLSPREGAISSACLSTSTGYHHRASSGEISPLGHDLGLGFGGIGLGGPGGAGGMGLGFGGGLLMGSPPSKMSRTIKSYHCRMCDREFENKSDMQRHAKEIRRAEEKGHKCAKCLKSFPSSQQLAQHSLVHSNLRKYPCRYCEKTFKQLSHVQQHQRIHTGERPYACQVEGCSKAFRQLSSLQQHIKGHNIPLPKSYHLNRAALGMTSPGFSTNHRASLAAGGGSIAAAAASAAAAAVFNTEESEEEDSKETVGEWSEASNKLHSSLARPHDLTCQVCEKHCSDEVQFFRHIHKCHPDYWRVFSGGRPLSDFIETGVDAPGSPASQDEETARGYQPPPGLQPPQVTERKYGCRICGIRFVSELIFMKHMLEHEAEERERGDGGMEGGGSEQGDGQFGDEMDVKPNPEDMQVQLCSCTVCGKYFTKESYLIRHMEMKVDPEHAAGLELLKKCSTLFRRPSSTYSLGHSPGSPRANDDSYLPANQFPVPERHAQFPQTQEYLSTSLVGDEMDAEMSRRGIKAKSYAENLDFRGEGKKFDLEDQTSTERGTDFSGVDPMHFAGKNVQERREGSPRPPQASGTSSPLDDRQFRVRRQPGDVPNYQLSTGGVEGLLKAAQGASNPRSVKESPEIRSPSRHSLYSPPQRAPLTPGVPVPAPPHLQRYPPEILGRAITPGGGNYDGEVHPRLSAPSRSSMDETPLQRAPSEEFPHLFSGQRVPGQMKSIERPGYYSPEDSPSAFHAQRFARMGAFAHPARGLEQPAEPHRAFQAGHFYPSEQLESFEDEEEIDLESRNRMRNFSRSSSELSLQPSDGGGAAQGFDFRRLAKTTDDFRRRASQEGQARGRMTAAPRSDFDIDTLRRGQEFAAASTDPRFDPRALDRPMSTALSHVREGEGFDKGHRRDLAPGRYQGDAGGLAGRSGSFSGPSRDPLEDQIRRGELTDRDIDAMLRRSDISERDIVNAISNLSRSLPGFR